MPKQWQKNRMPVAMALKRVLTLRDLTFFGIAAIIGAGSFSSLGQACFMAVPVWLCYLLSVRLPVDLLHYVIQNLPAAFPLPAVLTHMHMHRLANYLPG